MEKKDEGALRRAFEWALTAGTAVAAGSVWGQDAAPAPEETAAVDDIPTIVVTGTRIRRVDTETASPVAVIDRATIEASGVVTVGDLVRELPTISGAATNPRVNNGGGTGASTVSLRGLTEQRTLVLLNGRRMTPVTVGTDEGVDIDAIPINLIERVEVLKEGASAIYGSDAIGGVVNFITRKGFTGLELSYDYGITDEDDGQRQGVNLAAGFGGDRGNLMLGLNYNDQQGISAGDRSFSKAALYLYGGVVSAIGSSRTPNGRYFLPEDVLENNFSEDGTPGCGSGSVTRIDGALGTAIDDYRCYTNADSFNFQPFNLVLTPQERVGLFTVGNYQIHEKIEGYVELFYSNTKSGFQIAPLPFDARSDDVVISEDSIFNPLQTSFGGADGINPQFRLRLSALGNRRSESETNNGQVNLGLRGDLPVIESWRYDLSFSVGRTDESTDTFGYLFIPGIRDAVGPSFIDGEGVPRCGTPGNVISRCMPLNIFNLPAALSDPAQAGQFAAASAAYGEQKIRDQNVINLNFNGPLLKLPAGEAQLALGFEYRDQELETNVDFLAQGLAPDFLNCQLARETCTNETQGDLIAREYYAEVFVPVLAGQPLAHQLNLILGTRYSDYSRFDSSTNSKIALEWRPVKELLVRGSFAEVFRAPTINNLFLGVEANAPTFTDPCTGLTQDGLDGPNFLELACQNVTPDGEFVPVDGQVDGRFFGNQDLEPEEGDVITYGFVYDPDFLRGLSITVDFWEYDLDDTLEFLDVNTTANLCVATGAEQFCSLINRAPDGQVQFIDQPVVNLGSIETSGVDLGFKYRLPDTDFGQFRVGLDSSYTEKFERTVLGEKTEVDGTYDRQDGNFARWRGLGSLNWDYGNFQTLLIWRYIHGFKLKDADGNPPDTDGDGNPDQSILNFGSHSYFDASVEYRLPKLSTRFLVGVENAFDKKPPLLFQNNVINGNTDVETFDTIGRFFYGRISVDF